MNKKYIIYIFFCKINSIINISLLFLINTEYKENKQKICSFNQTHKPEEVCAVDVDSFDQCSPQNNYGYKNSRPCIFLKLNKIFNWVPEYYDDPASLPEDMPQDLKDEIAKTPMVEVCIKIYLILKKKKIIIIKIISASTNLGILQGSILSR